MAVRYLSIDEVLVIHEEMINLFGGSHGIRDFGLLHSAIERARVSFGGDDLYPTIFDKSAALIHSLVLNHPFIDGNKRTAITSCARFLFLNGWLLHLPTEEAYDFTVSLSTEKLTHETIVTWLKKHSKKV